MGCRRRAPAEELTRVVVRPDGSLDVGRALPGRGAWLCSGSPQCLDRADRRGAFGRALRAEVAPGAVAALRERLSGAEPSPSPSAGPKEQVGAAPEGPAAVMCEDKESGSPSGSRSTGEY